jgi:tetratricopeptide (TPR) repeat protein
VIARVGNLLQGLCRHPAAAAALLAAAVAVLGGGGYFAAARLGPERRLRAAREALERRDFPRARANLTLCLEARPDDAEVHCLAARAARGDGDYEDAADHLRACRRLGGAGGCAELEEALLHAQQGDLSGVEGYLRDRLGRDDADAPLILEALTHGYAQTHRLPQALVCAREWLRHRPDDARALFECGSAWDGLFFPGEARECYRRAVELDPEFDDARLRLAEHLLQAGRPAEALGHFERLAGEHPGDVPTLLGLARCQVEGGQVEAARRLLDQILAADPGHAPALAERGRVALEQGRPADAERWLRRAVAAAPHERTANYLLARSLQEGGNAAGAKLYLEKVRQIDADARRLDEVMEKLLKQPWDLSLRFEAATILLRAGRAQEGLDWLAGILREAPRHRPAHQALADYYEQSGHAARAARHRQLAREGGPARPRP